MKIQYSSSVVRPRSRPAFRSLVASFMFASASLALAQAPAPGSFSTLTVTQELTLSGSPFRLRSDGLIYDVRPRALNDAPLIDLSLSAPIDTGGNSSVFLWEAGRTAFRAGMFQRASLSPGNLGVGSFASGYSTVASGGFSFAGGLVTTASGYGATAFGSNTVATGAYSFAAGDTSYATAADALAMGFATSATAGASAAFNHGTSAHGHGSFAAGYGTVADSFASFVIGAFNNGGYSGTNGGQQWNAQDPVFEIGNGSDSWHRSNALTVLKNGNATFSGVVRVAPGGDIPMFGQ